MKLLRRPFDRTPSERAFDRVISLVAVVALFSGPALTFRFTAIPFVILCIASWFAAAFGLYQTWFEADNRVLRISTTVLLIAAAALILGLLKTNGWETLLNTDGFD